MDAGKIPDVMTNPNRDTTNYYCIQLSKADWLLNTSAMTDDEELWWIDIGLAHVSQIDSGQPLVIPALSSSVIACDERLEEYLKTLNASERTEYERKWPVAAGGIFGVRSPFIQEFQQIWWNQVDRFLGSEISPTDELVLSQIALHDHRVARVNGIHQNLFQSFVSAFAAPSGESNKSDSSILQLLPALKDLHSSKVVDLSGVSGWDSDWSCFNPSIATDNDGTILCLVRSSNYTIDGYTYKNLDDSGAIKTQTQCLTLDSEFNIIDSFWIAEPEVVTSAPQFPVHGIEDMRLSFDGINWIVTGTIRQHDSQGHCRQIIAKLNLENHQLEDLHIMPSPITPWKTDPTRVHEKNWLTLGASGNRQDLVWSSDPLVVIEWDWLTKNLAPKLGKPQPMNTFGLRGSTPFVETAIGHLGIVHELSQSNSWPNQVGGPSRRYAHRFVLIGESSSVPKFSDVFCFVGEGLEYAAGLALIDSRIVITFGQNDQTAHLLEIHLTEVEKLLST